MLNSGQTQPMNPFCCEMVATWLRCGCNVVTTWLRRGVVWSMSCSDGGRVVGQTGLIWLGGRGAPRAIPHARQTWSPKQLSLSITWNFWRLNTNVMLQFTVNYEDAASDSITFLKKITPGDLPEVRNFAVTRVRTWNDMWWHVNWFDTFVPHIIPIKSTIVG